MATRVLEHTEFTMGIAYYHPNEAEKVIMDELQECLSKEDEFKHICRDMLVPPLSIHPIMESVDYSHWIVTMLSVLAILLMIGAILDVRNRQKKLENDDDDEKDKSDDGPLSTIWNFIKFIRNKRNGDPLEVTKVLSSDRYVNSFKLLFCGRTESIRNIVAQIY